MEEILRELVNELRVQNRLLLMFYTHKAIGWDGFDNPSRLYDGEIAKANAVLGKIKQSLEGAD